MSIPLDRLYNYLDSIIEDDIIIYRFFPHGSRKLEDLLPLNELPQSWIKRMTTPCMIFHDQEPLDATRYNQNDWDKLTIKKVTYLADQEERAFLAENIKHMDLRIATNFTNCYDYTLLCHSEKHSSDVARYLNNGFIGVYWWSHAIIAKDWFRYAEHDPLLLPSVDRITKDFLIYNRAWTGTREYRLTFAEMLANLNLIDNCKIHFSPIDSGAYYSNHIFKNPNLSISRTDLENIYPLNQTLSSASADYDNKDYTECGIEVVLETLFDDERQHLTEKALRPIACGRPFILTATPGSLQYLRDYGFQTFDGLINETYDTILDPKDRLIAITNEMERISKMDVDTKNQLWNKLYEIAGRNKQRFFSKEFDDNVLTEFKNNLETGMKIMNENRTGKHWNQIRNTAVAAGGRIAEVLSENLPRRSLRDVKKVQEWLKLNNK